MQRRSKLFSDGAAVVLLDWKRVEVPRGQLALLPASRLRDAFPHTAWTAEPQPLGLESLGPKRHLPWPQEPTPTSIVACLSSAGQLCLCTDQLLALAMCGASGSGAGTPLTFQLSPDLSRGAVLIHRREEAAAALPRHHVDIETLDLALLSTNLHVVHRWGQTMTQLDSWMHGGFIPQGGGYCAMQE